MPIKKFILTAIPLSLLLISFKTYNEFLMPIYLNELPKEIGYIEKYKKNKWTKQKSSAKDKYYSFEYQFKDLGNGSHTWKWNSPKLESDKMINNFGVPPSIFKPYIVRDDIIKKRNKQIKDGYFVTRNNVVGPDYSALVSESLPLVQGIANLAKKTAEENNLSHRETIELIMSFCQDIPYGVPPKNYKGKNISGMFPPPLVLKSKWGDCDSKAVLFSSIFLAEPDRSVVLLESPGHISVGIEGIPGPYDKAVSYKGKKYIFTEPVGPGKTQLGKSVSPYVKVNNVYPIKLTKSKNQLSVPIMTESISTGNNIVFSLRENKRSIAKKLKVFYNHDGEDKTYFELTSPIKDNGSIKYSSEKTKIFVMINQRGYYHYGGYNVKKNTELNLDFSENNCIYIKTKPRQQVYLFKHINGEYEGLLLEADGRGIIRAVMETGEYFASITQTLSGGLKKFDRDNKTGITFSL